MTIPSSKRFPIIDDLRAEGVTDYIALPLPFVGGTVNGSSWTTKQPGGFTDEQLAALRSLVKPLARVVEILTLNRTAASLLDTYVGNRAGERIMGGQIQPRPHRDHECRDLAVRSARLHLACPIACRPRPWWIS